MPFPAPYVYVPLLNEPLPLVNVQLLNDLVTLVGLPV